MNYYELLGVEKDVTDKDLKKAYRSLCQKFHPDKNPDDPDAEERFKAIKHAYEVLSDPIKRKNYDETGSEENEPLLKAYQAIGSLYAEIAKRANYEKRNYLLDITSSVQNSLRECMQDKKKFEMNIERIAYLIKHTEGDQNILLGLSNDKNELEHKIKVADDAIEVIKIALDLLDKASYTGEVPVAPKGRSGAPWQTQPYVGA